MQWGRSKAWNKNTRAMRDDIQKRGEQQGIINEGRNNEDVHRLLSSSWVNHVANRYTCHCLFTDEDTEEDSISRNRQLAGTATLRYICKAP